VSTSTKQRAPLITRHYRTSQDACERAVRVLLRTSVKKAAEGAHPDPLIRDKGR